MLTRKFFGALLVLCIFASGSLAALPSQKIREVDGGVLRYLGTTEEDFQKGVDDLSYMLRGVSMFNFTDTNYDIKDTIEVVKAFKENRHVIKFFDSLTAMLMAMDAGKLDEISLPESTARYVMNSDPEYRILFTIRMPSSIAFGFRNDSAALCEEFNAAIKSMKSDGTLSELEKKYIGNGINFDSKPVDFAKFDGAETIKIAVTGDMPPVDYVDAAGEAAGYNTAVISEIGKRLKKNVELLSIESGARSAALASGRADVIFWYRTTQGMQLPEEAGVKDNPLNKIVSDKTEQVILSEPYYSWERVLFLTK